MQFAGLLLALFLGGCFVHTKTVVNYEGPCGLVGEAESLSRGGERFLDGVARVFGGETQVYHAEVVGRGGSAGTRGNTCTFRHGTEKIFVP